MNHPECAICLEKMDPENAAQKDNLMLVTTPCQHTYHKSCFEKWLSVSNTCPHCRTVLYEPVPVPILLPPFDGELQLQWIVHHGLSNMTRDYELRVQEQERDHMQNKLITVVSYVFCLIGTAYCLGDCSGTAGSWILGGWGS